MSQQFSWLSQLIYSNSFLLAFSLCSDSSFIPVPIQVHIYTPHANAYSTQLHNSFINSAFLVLSFVSMHNKKPQNKKSSLPLRPTLRQSLQQQRLASSREPKSFLLLFHPLFTFYLFPQYLLKWEKLCFCCWVFFFSF